MKRLLEHAQPGDTVVVWRIDRLGRSLIIERVNAGITAAPARRARQPAKPSKSSAGAEPPFTDTSVQPDSSTRLAKRACQLID